MDPPTPPDRANHSPLTYYPPDRSQPARNAFGFVETVLHFHYNNPNNEE